jgi:geranylgeranyl diphosphate synthase, type I
MDIQKTLADFKTKIDPEVKRYLDDIIERSKKKDAFVTDALKYVKKTLLAGGKRLRPAFMCYGYLAAGGKEWDKIIKTSVSVELIHTYLLIHDDIIDSDLMRHGMDTMHYHYRKIGKRLFFESDSRQFGDSMAIIIGDMVSALGNQVLFQSRFKPERVIKALNRLQDVVSLTVIGQSQDVGLGYKKRATEQEVMKMYENKTARYTIEGPLHLGAILAGADKKLLSVLSCYSVPIGMAFQIQDDILGIFGTEKKLGKPIGSDIKEGKQTILIIKARELSSKKEKVIIENILGKKDLSPEDVENFRKIIINTGALDYAKNMAESLISKGKKVLEGVVIEKKAKEFLLGIADYMINREL